jgi:HSP20 family protein
MTRLARREPFGIDFPRWLGRRFDERWWDELRPERMFELMTRGSVRVEEFRDEDALVVRAELPGVDPEKDVEISVHDGLLTIKGERTESTEETKKAFYRSEFSYGMFERTLPLPAGTTDKDVKATYKDGLLEVRVPMRTEQTEAARVRVERVG